jgi:hypothetical protein
MSSEFGELKMNNEKFDFENSNKIQSKMGRNNFSSCNLQNNNQMLNQVQHDSKKIIPVLVIPNQVLNLIQDLRLRDLGLVLNHKALKPPPLGGVLYKHRNERTITKLLFRTIKNDNGINQIFKEVIDECSELRTPNSKLLTQQGEIKNE